MNELVLKTKEYENLPANLLGLDGWILRSVPKEFRNQFLSGYEKLLRIAFHPDRCQSDEAKQTRGNYLQSIAQAVQFLSSGELEYELSTDHVPTKRNPFVLLKRDVQVRDDLIQKLDDEKQESISSLTSERKSNIHLRSQNTNLRNKASSIWKMHLELRNSLSETAKSFPTPLMFREYTLNGSFLKMGPEHELLFSEFVCGIRESNTAYYNLKGSLEETEKITFRNGKNRDRNLVVLGAIPIKALRLHLHSLDGFAKKSDANVTAERLSNIFNPKDDRKVLYAIKPFLFPFILEDCWLLVRHSVQMCNGADTSWKAIHRLFWVKHNNVRDNPEKALVESYKHDNDGLTLSNIQLKQQHDEDVKRLKAHNLALMTIDRQQSQINRLLGKVRKYELEINALKLKPRKKHRTKKVALT